MAKLKRIEPCAGIATSHELAYWLECQFPWLLDPDSDVNGGDVVDQLADCHSAYRTDALATIKRNKAELRREWKERNETT